MHKKFSPGFTLIELSIVLVIIGLIVGGVLVGQDLIRASEVRAQISQIEKYQTAANTFRSKYGFLPGDINAVAANQFNFAPRGLYAGEGDGDGQLEGIHFDALGGDDATSALNGENAMFWVDLSKANLIDGSFSLATANNASPSILTPADVANYLPAAKLSRGNFVYVWGGGYSGYACSFVGGEPCKGDGANYYAISIVTGAVTGYPVAKPGMSVQQAYQFDRKIDDGLAQTGNVTAQYDAGATPANWAAGGGNEGANAGASYAPTTAATPGSSTTCYDNSASNTGTPGVGGAPQHYSLEISNGANINCALSIRFQ